MSNRFTKAAASAAAKTTAQLADVEAKLVSRVYRPSNGIEADIFWSQWCDRCKRDEATHGCPIRAATFAFKRADPEYPTEWIYDKDGSPCCTAFEEAADE